MSRKYHINSKKKIAICKSTKRDCIFGSYDSYEDAVLAYKEKHNEDYESNKVKGERQIHGIKYEQLVIDRYGLIKDNEYTGVWDAYLGYTPVSIKTAKSGTAVEMADIFRNANVKEDFILIVSFWNYESVGGQIEKVYGEDLSLLIDRDYWRAQFNQGLMVELEDTFEGITNSRDDDDLWRDRRLYLQDRWKSIPSIVSVNFKRDHKNQKRIQCSVSNKNFFGILLPMFEEDIYDLL